MNQTLPALLIQTYQVLSPRFQKRAVAALALLILQSLAELLTLGTIIPAVPAFISPDTFFQKGIGAWFANLTQFHSPVLLSLSVLVVVILLFFMKNAFVHWVNRYQVSFAFTMFREISGKLYQHHLRSGLLAIRSRQSTEIARDIVGVPQRFTNNVVLSFLFLLTEVVVILALSTGVILYEPRAFAIVAATLLPSFVVFYLRVKRSIQKIDMKINTLEASLSKIVYQSLFGYADVVTTGSEDFFARRYTSLADQFAGALQRRTVLGLVPARLAEMSLILGVAVLCIYTTSSIPDLSARLTLFGVYLVSAYRLLPSANRITICLLSIRGNAFSLEVAKTARDTADTPLPATQKPVVFRESLRFENVRFGYPGSSSLVFSDLTLTIAKKGCVGIIGASGAGKSTFLNLLLGLLEPTGGAIQVDGTPLVRENIGSWRRKVGYVQQEVFLLDGTIQENIAFGLEESEIERERLAKAVELSAISDFVKKLPNGLLTNVGERGANLSVGQKQRIGIARALYHGAEVIVFDEATSALDAATEREITEATRRLQGAGLTIIMVSHRDQPLSVCDKIFHLEAGVLRE